MTEDIAPASKNRFDLGRRLRMCAGVNEETLAWVPNEKARYTGLGGVVLGTAVIAGLSMTMALAEVLGGFTGWLLLPAAVWTLFVLNLDRWLVSSSGSSRWHRRAGLLLPRLLIAIVFGAIIAEPLVLRIFQTAIEQHISDGRSGVLEDRAAELTRCNPVPGSKPVPADCSGRILHITQSPAAAMKQLSGAQSELRSNTKFLDKINAGTREVNRRALEACTQGSSQCARLQQEAAVYIAAHPIADATERGTQLTDEISGLQKKVADDSAAYDAELQRQIGLQVAALQNAQQSVGLLERFAALDQLTSGEHSMAIKHWAIRLFFILIDILPVLVKFFGGATTYDRITADKLEMITKVHKESLNSLQDQLVKRFKAEREEADGLIRRRLMDVGSQDRQHAADVRSNDDDAIDRLYAEMLADKRQTAGNKINGHKVYPRSAPV